MRVIGSRLDKLRPLAKQQVHPDDNVLGSVSRAPLPGLDVASYNEMVKAAFHSKWWQTHKVVGVAPDATVTFVDKAQSDGAEYYSLMQYNFALFFGIAVQMYEATLVSDDTPWDRFRRENPRRATPISIRTSISIRRTSAVWRSSARTCSTTVELGQSRLIVFHLSQW
jgi:hypothetical protein